MNLKSSIRAVNLQIREWIARHSDAQLSRAAMFAKATYAAKFEEPEGKISSSRRNDAWERWIAFDSSLRSEGLLGPSWAKARLLVHESLRNFSMGELMFTNGSSFIPLGNRTSIACKLTEEWTITAECFDLFARYSYWHRALKHAVKKRFTRYCKTKGWCERSINRKLWCRFKNRKEAAFQIYSFKLHSIVTFVGGNRWSTVPKNNLKDRAICLEPLCNMLVQRAVGLGLRRCLLTSFGVDLDHLADVHRDLIRDSNVSTIDLSDCSDAISMRLIKYLLPTRVFNKISASRSDMTLGPDDNYYVVNKVSSMGNGFTFDLMTLVLTALTRSFDTTSSVFGDDIICQNQYAEQVVDSLRIAGFVVNPKKTNIKSDYRESCGAHYIDGYGYLTVFDQRWIKEPHDLVVACNKAAILSSIYGEPFEDLRARIWACVPRSLLGATVSRLTVHTGRPPSYDLSTYIRYGPALSWAASKKVIKAVRRACAGYQKPVSNRSLSFAVAFENRAAPASSSLRAEDWDMFFQHIHNCRLTRKVQRLVLKSTLVARIDEEQIGFVNRFCTQ